MLARLLDGLALILFILAILGLLNVFVIGIGWVALFVAAIVCAIVAEFVLGGGLAGRRGYYRGGGTAL